MISIHFHNFSVQFFAFFLILPKNKNERREPIPNARFQSGYSASSTTTKCGNSPASKWECSITTGICARSERICAGFHFTISATGISATAATTATLPTTSKPICRKWWWWREWESRAQPSVPILAARQLQVRSGSVLVLRLQPTLVPETGQDHPGGKQPIAEDSAMRGLRAEEYGCIAESDDTAQCQQQKEQLMLGWNIV